MKQYLARGKSSRWDQVVQSHLLSGREGQVC
jgi:hypothetical protein